MSARDTEERAREQVLSSAQDAIVEWRMLRGVERLGVALSGGADSLTLLEILVQLELQVELVPLIIYQHPEHQRPGSLRDHVRKRHGLTLHVEEADTTEQIQPLLTAGKAPCRACAPVRSRRISETAARLDLQAVALGHHLDDAVATLLMNLFHRGELDTFRPVARRNSRAGVRLVRPLIFSTEGAVKAASPLGSAGLFACGVCTVHATERARMSRFAASVFDAHAPAARFGAEVIRDLALQGDPG